MINERKISYYGHLNQSHQIFLEEIFRRYRFTFQEWRQMIEVARDLEMWSEIPLRDLWESTEKKILQRINGRQRKKIILQKVHASIRRLKIMSRHYPAVSAPSSGHDFRVICRSNTPKRLSGECPANSMKTLCCNLKTIDAVENCVYACSYCAVQTFYGDEITIHSSLKEHLAKIKIKPEVFYHFGTGQSSDSLAFGNISGLLDDLCEFAKSNPNILLELKTKSKNVSYFLNRVIPKNVVLSWSLNTQTIISNEERGTASLNDRLEAAKQVAETGLKVAFHFHPLIHYTNCLNEYETLANQVQALFASDQIAFISFGVLKFTKTVMRAIRERGGGTKILQMEMLKDATGKFTYPDSIKMLLLRNIYQSFVPWHRCVYMYLCMENAEMWDRLFGWHHQSSAAFEVDFKRRVMGSI